jgi:SEC-C motif-containing protein
MQQDSCPCESGKPYASCCKPCHQGVPATHAESLMRARYSAYVLGLTQYVLDTWHPDNRPSALHLNDDIATKWLGLSIKRVEETSKTTAIVEFVARYKIGGNRAEKLHEISKFEYSDRWYYLSGDILTDNKT